MINRNDGEVQNLIGHHVLFISDPACEDRPLDTVATGMVMDAYSTALGFKIMDVQHDHTQEVQRLRIEESLLCVLSTLEGGDAVSRL